MTDRNYNASKLTNEELINKLKSHSQYYNKYWDLERLELVKEDTAAILLEAANRLEQFWKGN
jgi:hypothetical protein